MRRSGRTADWRRCFGCLLLLLSGGSWAADYWPFSQPPAGAVGVLPLSGLQDASQLDSTLTVFERPGGRAEQRTLAELAYIETAYEEAAALVFAREPGWLALAVRKVKADSMLGIDRLVWLRVNSPGEFQPLVSLLNADRLLYLTEHWHGQLAAKPGGKTRATMGLPAREGLQVQLLQQRNLAGQVWLEVALRDSICRGAASEQVYAQGWLPFKNAAGRFNLWFHSRGC